MPLSFLYEFLALLGLFDYFLVSDLFFFFLVGSRNELKLKLTVHVTWNDSEV